jgi:hypothetical protein
MMIDSSFKKIESEINTYENEKRVDNEDLKIELNKIKEVVDVFVFFKIDRITEIE